ncbi:MAG: thioredoxin family protein [Phycisphaerae bacterium]|nr:thioredoxin family protein [Phycisphaerae bacterium]
MRYKLIFLLLVFFGAMFCYAEIGDGQTQTVEQLYPNLAAGVLTYAKVDTLKNGVLFKTSDIQITQSDIDAAISKQPQQFQQELRKNAFFILEQEATGKLLIKLAKGKLSKDVNSIDDNQLVQAFFKELTKDVKVTEQDVEIFYKENESVFCGTPLESVRKQIESYVLQDKQQRFVDQYIQTLGQKIEITVSDLWTKQQAVNAKDNPLDKARTAGKPTLAIFSAASCCGPDKMIPVQEALIKKYNSKINIVYIEPRKEQILAARYGIRSIPSQLIFDSKGKEHFRHSGFFSEQDIIGKLNELGVQ